MKAPLPILLLFLCATPCTMPCAAQTGAVRLGQPAQAAPAATGTVHGRVFCTDTQRPAKFAEVQLMQERSADSEARNAGLAGAGPQYNSVAQGRTALDGTFSISGIPPGDYFVVGNATGYLSAITVARQTGSGLRAPQVHVDANRMAEAQVSIDRGASVSGRVLFDDGTPASGVSVQVRTLVSNGTDSSLPGFAFGGRFTFGGSQVTDDRGVYRISGVPPGKYNVAAMLQTEGTERTPDRRGGGGFPQSVTVYAPATMRRAEARVLEIRGADAIEGVDLQVSLAGLHTVRGVLEAKADSHPLSSGFANIADIADGTLTRFVPVASDGTFTLEYLPAGTYNLRLAGSDRSENAGRRGNANGIRYQPVTVNVVIGDHDVVLDPTLLDAIKTDAAPTP